MKIQNLRKKKGSKTNLTTSGILNKKDQCLYQVLQA